MRNLLGYGRRALRAKLWAFLPPCWCLVLADVQHHPSSRSCRSCCSPATTTTFFIIISISSSSRRASSREESAPLEWGGSRSRWQAGRTSINLHQLKVEEDRHALYQISANYMSSSSRSLQTTTTVVLTIINNMTTPTTSAPCNATTTRLLPQPSTAHERH